jgi:flagellin
MGLRINTNVAALDALRNLNISEANQNQSLERLSSGLRINTAADDPAGLVISNQLDGQIAALQQDSQNSQTAVNLVSTANDALQNINTLLVQIQGAVQFALNTGGNSPAQIAAEQSTVDQAVQAINRVAHTTRYGNLSLLNGSAGYQLNGSVGAWSGGTLSPGVTNLNFQSLTFQPGTTTRTLTMAIVRDPLRASLVATGLGAGTTATTILVTGDRGSAQVQLAANATVTAVGAAINSISDQTGVVFAKSNGTFVVASEGFGSGQFESVQVLAGALVGGTFAGGVGHVASKSGADGKVSFEGATYTAKGLNFSVNSPDATFQFSLNSDLFAFKSAAANSAPTVGAHLRLFVQNTGLAFQIREQNTTSDRLNVGIGSVDSGTLGLAQYIDAVATAQNGAVNVTLGGVLSSLQTGAGNDLTQNAANAENIVNAAAQQVSGIQGFLGAVVADNVQPNIDSIAVATTNLQSSNSSIKDLNFAQESENLAKSQVIFQSGIAALAAAKLLPQSVLQLLH